VLAHLARDVSQDLVAVGQLYAEHRVWKSFHNRAFDLDYTVFVCHTLTYFVVALSLWSNDLNARKKPKLALGIKRVETPSFNPSRNLLEMLGGIYS
jgi:hypothetical protein